MKIKIEVGKGQGKLLLPPAKSLFHRALFCAAMAQGESKICGHLAGDDLSATIRAIESLGAKVRIEKDFVTICGTAPFSRQTAQLDCASSGTTLRLSVPLFLLSGESVTISMSEQLSARPMEVYGDLLCKKGVSFAQSGQTIYASGKLAPGDYPLPGNLSSQFLSGLLLALPLLDDDSRIHLTTPLESRPYVNLTRQMQAAFFVKSEETADGFLIPGGQSYHATKISIEGDATIAASYDALNWLGSQIECVGLPKDSKQGDSVFPTLLENLVAGEAVDLSDTPDLAPLLFALAAVIGKGRFVGTRRLAYKESNRASSMKAELSAFGVDLEVLENEVLVKGILHAPSRILSSHGDHRIAMALALLATKTGGIIDGAECVAKSYPEFWSDLQSLGFGVEEE